MVRLRIVYGSWGLNMDVESFEVDRSREEGVFFVSAIARVHCG